MTKDKLSDTVKGLIDLVSCYDDTNKFYWIDALDTSNANKGILIRFFNL